ncbi:MAG: TolC family protein [Bacteroidales bacterium]|nr:TolC family protein [Bacteroidales bacterium]
MKISQQTTVNGQQSSSTSLAIGLLSLVLLFLFPLRSSAQKEIDLEVIIPEKWQIDTIYLTNDITDYDWWTRFEDSTLDSLIAVALSNNYNLQSIEATLEKSRLSYQQSKSAFYPSLSLDAQYDLSETSLNYYEETSSDQYRTNGYLNAGLNATWEIDVFGKNRDNVKANKKSYLATEASYQNAIMNLCAQVATVYFNLRSYQQQLIVANQNISSEKNILDITIARYESGLGTQLDVSQAKSVYYNTLATIPRLDAYITQCVNNLAILLGTYPSNLKDSFNDISELPSIRHIVNVGIPADVIRNRPDVRQAELNIEAQAASIGATKADFYPKFKITGSFGYLSHDLDEFFNNESMMFQVTPSISWNLFSGMEVRKAVQMSEIALEEYIDNYNNVVLNAIQEVETEMSNYANALKTIEMGQQVVEQGNKTLELSIDLYKRGLGTFTNVLDAQRTVLSDQNYLVSAWNSALLALVRLYTALGGTWE